MKYDPCERCLNRRDDYNTCAAGRSQEYAKRLEECPLQTPPEVGEKPC